MEQYQKIPEAIAGAFVVGFLISWLFNFISEIEIDSFLKGLLFFVPIVLYIGAIIVDALANLDSNKSLILWIIVSIAVYCITEDPWPIALTIGTMIAIQYFKRHQK